VRPRLCAPRDLMGGLHDVSPQNCNEPFIR
jgi:hypothetical protein